MVKITAFIVALSSCAIALLLIYKIALRKLGLDDNYSASPIQTAENINYIRNRRYPVYGKVLLTCIRENYSRFELARPNSLAAHMLDESRDVQWDSVQGWKFRYIFDRGLDGTKSGFHIPLSTKDCTEIADLINAFLPQYCRAAGLVPVEIIQSADEENGRISFIIAERMQNRIDRL